MRVPAIAVMAACMLAASAHASVQIEGINGRKVEFLHLKAAAPKAVVVFENGLRGTLDKWDKVVGGIKGDATVFAYNRPGYGKSEDTSKPRDGRVIVEELRGNLQHLGIKPPYVLVGHSLGGLYMQLFARMYPQEVKGVVLVDALYPGVIKRPDEFPLYARMARGLFFSSTVNREVDQIHSTGEAVLALPWQRQIPMIRLFNAPKAATAVGVDFGAVNADPKVRAMVGALYPDAKKVIVDSDHQMQVVTPEVIVQAIGEVIAAGNAPKR